MTLASSFNQPDGMPDWVDQTAPTDRDRTAPAAQWSSFPGSSTKATASARSLGPWSALATPEPSPKPYAPLTGRPAGDAWATFQSAVDTLPKGVANKDSFNGLQVQ
jgi:hypothetical protein